MPLDPSRGSLRLLRAGVFTSVAILLAAIGHSCAAGASSAALLSLLAAMPVILAGAWLLAARPRQFPLVLGVSVGVQCVLHLLLSRTSATAPVSLDAFWCHTRPLSQLPAGTALVGWHPHSAGSSWHMFAAHLLAAAAAGIWLARGDRALESLLRLLTEASAALGIALPASLTPATAAVDTDRGRSEWQPVWHPRRLQLIRVSAARRGPPAHAC